MAKKKQRTLDELDVSLKDFCKKNAPTSGSEVASLLLTSKDYTKADICILLGGLIDEIERMDFDKFLEDDEAEDNAETIASSVSSQKDKPEVTEDKPVVEAPKSIGKQVFSSTPEVRLPHTLLIKKKPPLGTTRDKNAYFLKFLFENNVRNGITLAVLSRVGYVLLSSEPLNGKENLNVHDSGYSLIASSSRNHFFDLVKVEE